VSCWIKLGLGLGLGFGLGLSIIKDNSRQAAEIREQSTEFEAEDVV